MPAPKLKPAGLVDAYAALKAEQAKLKKQEETLKKALFRSAKRDKDGLLYVEGSQHRLTISEIEPGLVFDAKTAQELIPAKLLKLCQKWREGSLRFNVKGKVADAAEKEAA